MSETVIIRLKEIIEKNSKRAITVDDLKNGANLMSDLGFDSVQMLQLMVEIEHEFSVEFDDEELDFDNICSSKFLLAKIASSEACN